MYTSPDECVPHDCYKIREKKQMPTVAFNHLNVNTCSMSQNNDDDVIVIRDD